MTTHKAKPRRLVRGSTRIINASARLRCTAAILPTIGELLTATSRIAETLTRVEQVLKLGHVAAELAQKGDHVAALSAFRDLAQTTQRHRDELERIFGPLPSEALQSHRS